MDMTGLRAQSFTTKPLTFLQEWLAVRRKGQDFVHTPMGQVCQGKPLLENHPFFLKYENSESKKEYLQMRRDRVEGVEEEVEVEVELFDADAEYDQGAADN